MTIWARNPDTGVAKWVYQMTPHDEWDYDGVNEMILADQTIDGKERKLWCISIATASAIRSTAIPANCWSREKYDPAVNWATKVDMDKTPDVWPAEPASGSTRRKHNGEDVNS